MDKRFITAFITPKEWDIVGYRLKPYSIRKHINLAAIDSPYVTGQVPEAKDTLMFLKYCSSDCESIIDTPKPSLFDTIAYFRIKYDIAFHIFVIKAIVNYIKEHTTGPSYRLVNRSNIPKKETIVQNGSIPDLLSLASILMAKLHMTEEKVLSLPINRLIWYTACVAQMEGSEVIIAEDTNDFQSQKEELIAWEKEQAEKLRLAMVNGKIPKRKIKTATES